MCLCRSQQPLVEPALLVSTVGGAATKPVIVLASPFPLSSLLTSSCPARLAPYCSENSLGKPWSKRFLPAATSASNLPLLLCLPQSGVLSKSLLECHFIPEAALWFNGPVGGPLWSDKGEYPCYLNMQMHPPMRLLIPLLFLVIYHLLI